MPLVKFNAVTYKEVGDYAPKWDDDEDYKKCEGVGKEAKGWEFVKYDSEVKEIGD